MIPLDHRDRGNRVDPYTEPNSCFSDSSDSLNSLNAIKVPLHLEKTLFTSLLCSVEFAGLFAARPPSRVSCLRFCGFVF